MYQLMLCAAVYFFCWSGTPQVAVGSFCFDSTRKTTMLNNFIITDLFQHEISPSTDA